jgi:hypothetical protein
MRFNARTAFVGAAGVRPVPSSNNHYESGAWIKTQLRAKLLPLSAFCGCRRRIMDWYRLYFIS